MKIRNQIGEHSSWFIE